MDFGARDTAPALLRRARERRKCISPAFGARDSDGRLARYGRLIMRYFGAHSFYRRCTANSFSFPASLTGRA